MRKIAIIYNPISGQGKNKEIAMTVKSELMRLSPEILDVQMHEISGSQDAYIFARKCTEDLYDTIAVMGGDGTLNQVAAGITDGGNQTKMGIIPVGTVNNLARALKLPLTVLEAAQVLINGEIRAIDLGKVNDQYMISSMTIGLLADAATNVTNEKKRELGSFAYVYDFFKVLKNYKSYPLALYFDGGRIISKMSILLITMTNSVGGFQSFTPNARVDDGLMHVHVLNQLSLPKLANYLPQLTDGNFSEIPMLQYFNTSSLEINSIGNRKKKIQARIDGDPGSYVPLELFVLPKSLAVWVPKEN